ncbi:MAG: TIGR03364 family FAD-dependent oxidoreductase [Sphingobacteriales bacterium]|nr:MAG: TIGR03364 family FAD-dependent oxidoreductase [Sphingobacteriales bacterium]
METRSAIVIGAGIVGLATARALAIRGFSVNVFDKNHKAVGASVRNFGMVWPIGQPSGNLFDRAMISRSIWKEVCTEAGIWYDDTGSLHLAYHPDEWTVLQELNTLFLKERKTALLNKEQTLARSEAIVENGLIGSLFSATEVIVDPRQAIELIPAYLEEKYDVTFHWGKCISFITDNTAFIGNHEEYEADLFFICTGADFETLYPEEFDRLQITKCKLQMMRFAPQPQFWKIGPSLCGGLSLAHYGSFKAAPSLPALRKRYNDEMSEYMDWGIHVMVSQNEKGELTVGDSHEYGLTHDPFDKDFINKMVIDYLKTFAKFKSYQLAETWNGVYAKMTNGDTEIFFSPDKDVYILNGVGGAGMTLSFGLAEESVNSII